MAIGNGDYDPDVLGKKEIGVLYDRGQPEGIQPYKVSCLKKRGRGIFRLAWNKDFVSGLKGLKVEGNIGHISEMPFQAGLE